MRPRASQGPCTARSAAFHRCALSVANRWLIGIEVGAVGQEERNPAPPLSMAARTAGALRLEDSFMTTTSPALEVASQAVV